MAFADPTKNVNYFELEPNMLVADFGAGTGAYALAMSRPILPNGKVYAVEVQKELLGRLKNDAQAQNIRNVDVVWGDIENLGGSKLADGIIDFVLISNVLFLSKSAYNIVLETKRILKAGGRVGLVDWTDSFGGLGPRPEDVLTESNAKKLFEQAGLTFVRNFPAGDHHYGLIFAKP